MFCLSGLGLVDTLPHVTGQLSQRVISKGHLRELWELSTLNEKGTQF